MIVLCYNGLEYQDGVVHIEKSMNQEFVTVILFQLPKKLCHVPGNLMVKLIKRCIEVNTCFKIS